MHDCDEGKKLKITLDTFIIADTHFGHKAVLKKEPSRNLTLENTSFRDFDELSIAWWNEEVKEKDSVLHLGDLYFHRGYELLNRLNGKKKMLVMGNNDIGKCEKLENWKVIDKIKFKIKDKLYYKKALKKRWGSELQNPYATALITEVDNVRILFSHFPVDERRKNDKHWRARDLIDFAYHLADCELNVHGHIHSRDSRHHYCFNASTEKLNFRPRKLKEILFEWNNNCASNMLKQMEARSS